MFITKEQWLQLVEEFGDDACQRVCLCFFEEDKLKVFSNEYADFSLHHFILKPISELIAHDIEFYGDNAYLMWQWGNIFNGLILKDVIDNSMLCFYSREGIVLKRKTSAAMPFDLGRAKRGEKIQVIYNNNLIDCYYDNEYNGYLDIEKCTVSWDNNNFRQTMPFGLLRMKYPERKPALHKQTSDQCA